MRRERARQLFGQLPIPTPVFGVDSTPRMSGWDGAIWDDFSSWTCPFPVGDMDRPLSLTYWGRFARCARCAVTPPLSPGLPSVMRFRATRCIYVYCEIGTLSWVQGDTFSVFSIEHQFLPLLSSDLFCFLLWS